MIKKTILAALFTLAVGANALAAPVPVQPPMKPAVMQPAPAMPPATATAMKPEAKPAMAVAKPAPVVAPMTAEAGMKAPVAADTNTNAAKSAAPKASKDELASTWINKLAPYFIMLVILILGWTGGRKYLQHERARTIIGGIRDGVKSWLKYSEGTPQKWDDAVAKMLIDLSDKLLAEGQQPLTEKEQAAGKKQADVVKSLLGPDKE
jgi:hypothetical protein